MIFRMSASLATVPPVQGRVMRKTNDGPNEFRRIRRQRNLDCNASLGKLAIRPELS
jgi:hypothetical protein